MASPDSPFSQHFPLFSATALRYPAAIVREEPISSEMLHSLPLSSPLRKSKFLAEQSHSLASTALLNNHTLDAFCQLLPSTRGSCVVLPVNWLVGSGVSNAAKVMLGLGGASGEERHIVLIDNKPDAFTLRTPAMVELAKHTVSQDLHELLGCSYDPKHRRLLVVTRDCIVCLCYNGDIHFRLFIVSVDDLYANMCVWDPLNIAACISPDAQVIAAHRVMQRLLPNHVVSLVKATSMSLLHHHKVFAIEQTDSYQCGPFCIRALVALLNSSELHLGEHSLRNICIWMAACLAEGAISWFKSGH